MGDPVRSTAGELDRARPLLRRAPMITPHETAADQGVGSLQQPHHHANRIPEKTAVARIMHERGGDRAVEPYDLAGLDFLLTRAGKQDAIDRLPCFGPDGADCHVQHRLLRRPRQRQPSEGAERGGVFRMKRHLLVGGQAASKTLPTGPRRRGSSLPTPRRRRAPSTSPGILRGGRRSWRRSRPNCAPRGRGGATGAARRGLPRRILQNRRAIVGARRAAAVRPAGRAWRDPGTDRTRDVPALWALSDGARAKTRRRTRPRPRP